MTRISKKHKERHGHARRAAMAGLAGSVIMAGMAVPAAMATPSLFTAEQLATDQTLTLDATRDLSGSSFKAVQLAEYSAGSYENGVITGLDVRDSGHAAAINKALVDANIDTTVNGTDAYKKYDATNPMAWVLENLLDSSTSPFAGQLRNFLTELNRANLQEANGTAMSVSGESASASVKPGVYVVFDTTTNKEASIPMLNGTGINGITTMRTSSGEYQLGTVEYKYTDPAISKKILSVTNGTVSEDKLAATAQIGDTITYELTTNVPNTTGYDDFHFSVTDILGEGLLFDQTKSIKVGGAEIYDGGNKVAVSANGQTVVWTLGENANIANDATFEPFKDIVITYTATLDKDAEVDGNTQGSNSNIASIEYSNNVNQQGTGSTATDESNTVEVMTGAIEILKQDTSAKPLAGAEFQITRNADNSIVNLVDLGGGAYRVADGKQDTTTTTTMISPDSGKITVTGLTGEYKVKETKSPLYDHQLPQFTVNVLNNTDDGTFTASMSEQDANKLAVETENSTHGFTVTNVRNLLEMPKTGANYMIAYAVAALSLLGGFFALKKRGSMLKNENKHQK